MRCRSIVLLLFIPMMTLSASGQPSTERQVRAVRTSDAPPPPDLLAAGDLLWPKVPGMWVPYSSKPGTEQETEAEEWRRERDAYLKELRAKKNPTEEEKARYRELSKLDYPTFKVLYLGDADPTQTQPFGGSVFYVGHVGIVDIVDGTPWVYEAVLGKGVRKISYGDWLKERKGELVWLGRLMGASPEKRSAVARIAKQYIGKPYRFFNFDLGDTSGFYCSKLAWFAITTATGIAPDDNASPRRLLWYSPKRLMKSPHLELLYNPGNYAVR